MNWHKTKNTSRRDFIKNSLWALGAVCAGSVLQILKWDDEWTVPDLSTLNPGSSVDLKTTLPVKWRLLHGSGSFSVDPGGASLPAGITLTEDGWLKVAPNVVSCESKGVIFKYTHG
jgi:hypothetical protein